MQPMNKKYMLFQIILLALMVAVIARHVEYYKNFYYNSSYLTAHITGIGGSMMILLLSKLIGRIPIVSYIGKFSIIVLCTHIILLELSLPFVRNYFPPSQCLIIVFAFILLSELFLIPFFVKYLPYVTAQKNLL